jgi:hypothetical protein
VTLNTIKQTNKQTNILAIVYAGNDFKFGSKTSDVY